MKDSIPNLLICYSFDSASGEHEREENERGVVADDDGHELFQVSCVSPSSQK